MIRNILPVIIVFFACVSFVHSDDWPQWRGPDFNGASPETGLPESCDTDNIIWTTPMPGAGASTPVILGKRIFLTSVNKSQGTLHALGIDLTTGKIIWNIKIGKDRKFNRNNPCSPSPIADCENQRVYFLFGSGDLAACDIDGNILWKRNLEKDHGKWSIQFGYASSPLLFENRLYVPVLQRNVPIKQEDRDGRDKSSYLLAIDPATGKDLWKHIRPSDARKESLEAYTTPIPWVSGKQKQILLYGGDCLTGHDPNTGKEIWRWSGFNMEKHSQWRVVPCPVVTRNLIYVSAPKKHPLYAVKTGAIGATGMEQVAWKYETFSTDAATPLLYNGKLYVLDGDKKIITCLDPDTGKVVCQASLPKKAVYRASPTGGDGKIYLINERSDVVILSADKLQILSEKYINGGLSRSTIVATAGKLVIRTEKKLLCIGKKP